MNGLENMTVASYEQAEAQLRYQAQLLAAIKDAVIATDECLMITSWNPAAEAIYGWTAGEVIDCSLPEVLPTEFIDTTWEGKILPQSQNLFWEVVRERNVKFVETPSGTGSCHHEHG